MFNKKIFGILFMFCLIGLVVINLSGCAEKIVNDNDKSNVTISISSKFLGLENSELANVFVLTVEGEDFPGPIIFPLTLQGSVVSGQVIVPVGTDRIFTISAINDLVSGTLIYQGVDTADVIFDKTILVNIDMFPVVPLLKVIPKVLGQRVSLIAMGESFSVDVYAYNIPNVQSVDIDFSYLTSNFLIFPFGVDPGKDLPADSRVSYVGGNATVTVSLDRPFLAGPLVDSLGNAHLLTIYFSTHSDTNADADTALLDIITPISLDRGNGEILDLFPRDSLYLEQSAVELYKVSDS